MRETILGTAGEMARLEAVDFMRMGFIASILHDEVRSALVLFAITVGVLVLDRAVCVGWRKYKRVKERRSGRHRRGGHRAAAESAVPAE